LTEKPLAQLIREHIDQFKVKQEKFSKYGKWDIVRLTQFQITELETIQTALNEVIKQIESKHLESKQMADVQPESPAYVASISWRSFWECQESAYEGVLELLNGNGKTSSTK